MYEVWCSTCIILTLKRIPEKNWASFCRWLFIIIKGALQKKVIALCFDGRRVFAVYSRIAALVLMASMGCRSFVQQGWPLLI